MPGDEVALDERLLDEYPKDCCATSLGSYCCCCWLGGIRAGLDVGIDPLVDAGLG